MHNAQCIMHNAPLRPLVALFSAAWTLTVFGALPPPDFTEDFASGEVSTWGGMGERCVIAPNGGRNGSAGAVAEGSKKGCGLSRRFAAAPGSYEFTYWARPVDVKGEIGIRGGVEFYDRNGKFLHPFHYASPQGEPDADGWQKVFIRVPRIPEAATQIGVFIQCAPGSTGTAYFDDISLRPAVSPLVATMVSPLNQTAAPGDTVSIRIVRENDDPPMADGAEGTVRLGFGGTIPEMLLPLVEGLFTFTLSEVPDGPCPLSISLVDTGGADVGTLSFPLNVRRRPRRTTFDALGRMFIDGRPFMPLGFYSGGASERERKYLRECGANVLIPYNSFGGLGWNIGEIKKSIAELDAIGVKTVFSLSSVFPGIRWSRTEFDGAKGAVAVVDKVVRGLRDEPGLLAWYLNDELSFSDALVARRDQVSALDPDHPALVEVYQVDSAAAYHRTADAFGVCAYPIKDRPPAETALPSSKIERHCAAFGADGFPIWGIPQAHNPVVYGKEGGRAPTEEEMRTIALAFAGRGAKGFVFYMLSDLWSKRQLPDGETAFAAHWPEVCRVFAFLRGFEPWIMGATPVERLAASAIKVDGDVSAYIFRDDAGRARVAIVAAGPGRSSAHIALKGKWRSLFGRTNDRGGGAWTFSGEGICSDVLEELELSTTNPR